MVCAINFLPHRDDLIEGKTDYGCCPQCCAGCVVLKELVDAGTLSDAIRLAPADWGFRRYDWWDQENDRFDQSWPEAWWNLYPCPNHEDLGDDEAS